MNEVTAAQTEPAASRGRVAGMPPDLVWLEPGFAIGGRPFAAQREQIRRLGIDTVIILHEPEPGELEHWAELCVEALVFPTRDWVGIPAERFTAVVEAVLTQRRQGRSVLLHCLAGINRAPTLAAAVLCRRDRLPVEEAIARVRAARLNAAPTPEQAASLREWVEQYPSHDR